MDEFCSSLQRKLEEFLVSLREEEAIKRWVGHPRFLAMYEKYEASVRSSLVEAIARYKLVAVETERQEVFYRDLAVSTIKKTLDMFLDSCKQVMKSSADAMVAAFEDPSRG